MCQRLYIATRTELLPVRKTRSAPFLDLQPVGDAGCALRRHLSTQDFPYIYVAHAHEQCGCGFPEEYIARKPPKAVPEDRKTMAALQTALSRAVRGRPRVKILLAFIGMENDPVNEGRSVPLSELTNLEFWLQRGEVVTVLKAP